MKANKESWMALTTSIQSKKGVVKVDLRVNGMTDNGMRVL